MSGRLLRALQRSADAHGVVVTLEMRTTAPWDSATFSGFLHRLEVSADSSAALDPWLGALSEVDLPMPGQIAADITIIERTAGGAIVDVLTIVE